MKPSELKNWDDIKAYIEQNPNTKTLWVTRKVWKGFSQISYNGVRILPTDYMAVQMDRIRKNKG